MKLKILYFLILLVSSSAFGLSSGTITFINHSRQALYLYPVNGEFGMFSPGFLFLPSNASKNVEIHPGLISTSTVYIRGVPGWQPLGSREYAGDSVYFRLSLSPYNKNSSSVLVDGYISRGIAYSWTNYQLINYITFCDPSHYVPPYGCT